MNDKNKRLVVVIIIILMIFLSFITIRYFEKINNFIPTGSSDIFNINVDVGDKNIEAPKFEEQNSELGRVFASDKNGEYIYQQKLNIFSNPAYQMKAIVAPGDTNEYRFVIKNNTKQDIIYKIKMTEINEYNINMKYRLKKNNTYVIGDKTTWVTSNELILENIYLNNNDYSTFSLEWKWFDGENDNYIGKNMTSLYQLNIMIDFKGTSNE